MVFAPDLGIGIPGFIFPSEVDTMAQFAPLLNDLMTQARGTGDGNSPRRQGVNVRAPESADHVA